MIADAHAWATASGFVGVAWAAAFAWWAVCKYGWPGEVEWSAEPEDDGPGTVSKTG